MNLMVHIKHPLIILQDRHYLPEQLELDLGNVSVCQHNRQVQGRF